ncbi:hypothetical protein ACSFB8_02245 [Enterococcus faecalis]
MIEKYNLNNKKLILFLGLVYSLLNLVLAKLFERSDIAKKLFLDPDVSRLLTKNSYFLIAGMITLISILTAVFMTFIYRNLLKLIFNESKSWETINFCYLTSLIAGVFLSIIILSINKSIDMSVLSRITNLTTVVIINSLFYWINRKKKEQILVLAISIINASVVFLL